LNKLKGGFMRSIHYDKYGGSELMYLKDMEKPEPKNNEVLVKIHYATVTSGDVRIRKSDFPKAFWLFARLMFGLFKPKRNILGHEFSGRVEAVGSDVNLFQAGDDVFGTTTSLQYGSYAEYVCVPQEWKAGVIAKKPSALTYEDAAALPIGAMTALYLLNKGQVEKAKKVLIYGASGSVGSYAVQLAKHFGAEVTAVCSEKNFDMVKAIGANHLIDYKTTPIDKLEGHFDLVMDAVYKLKKSDVKHLLNNEARFVSVASPTNEDTDQLKLLSELAAQGIIKPFIDRIYPLNETPQAHAYAETHRKRGNLLIKVIE